MNPNPSDPVIDEIREVRHRISERFAHDPAQLVAYYAKLQEQYRDRLIGTVKPPERTDYSAG
jgi:hypothetical protein